MERQSKESRRYSPEEEAAAIPTVRTLSVDLGTIHGTAQRVADQLGFRV